MSITAQQIRSFEEHGYLTGIDIHDDAHVARIRDAFDELEAREGTENCEIGLQGRHVDVKFIWELASEAKILNCIEALMGRPVEANSLGKPWPAVLARGQDRFKNFGEWQLGFA